MVLSVLGDETSEKTEEDEVTDSFLFWMSSCKTVFSEATVLLAVGSVVAGCSGLPSGKTLPYSQKVDCLSSLLIRERLSP